MSSYIRFVLTTRVRGSRSRQGFFAAAYQLRGRLTPESPASVALKDLLIWFEKNLAVPERFNRTTSKGFYRREAKGLSWFKDEDGEALDKAFALARLLTDNGYAVEVLRTTRIGYVIFEDEHQVVAEPFADTPA